MLGEKPFHQAVAVRDGFWAIIQPKVLVNRLIGVVGSVQQSVYIV